MSPRAAAVLLVVLLGAPLLSGCFWMRCVSDVQWHDPQAWDRLEAHEGMNTSYTRPRLPLYNTSGAEAPSVVSLQSVRWTAATDEDVSVSFAMSTRGLPEGGSASRGLGVRPAGVVPASEIERLTDMFITQITEPLTPFDAEPWRERFWADNHRALRDVTDGAGNVGVDRLVFVVPYVPDLSGIYQKAADHPEGRRTTIHAPLDSMEVVVDTRDNWTVTAIYAMRYVHLEREGVWLETDAAGGVRIMEPPWKLGDGDRVRKWAADVAEGAGLDRPDIDQMRVFTMGCDDH